MQNIDIFFQVLSVCLNNVYSYFSTIALVLQTLIFLATEVKNAELNE